MRPNVDIPGEINQKVKDLTMVTDADNLSQAYIKVLKAGLRQYPNPSVPSVGFPQSEFDIGSMDYIRFSGDRTFKNVIWSKYITNKDNLVTFGGNIDSKSHTEFRNLTRSLAPYLSNNGSESQYTLSQFSGQWIGNGIQGFVSALEKQEERYEVWAPRETHDREKGILISDMRLGGLVIIYFQRRVGKDLLENGRIEFVTDGIPMEIRQYIEMASIFETSLSNAHLTEIPVHDILGRERIKIEPGCIEELRSDNSGTDGMISSMKIENIITKDRVAHLERPAQKAILEPDEMICHLGHHRLSSDHSKHGTEFWIDNLKIRALPTSRDPLFGVQSTADWQDKNDK